MAVGPSIAPMMPIDAASLIGKPRHRASIRVTKMPNCPPRPGAPFGVLQQRAEIGHRADADEDEQREQLGADPSVIQDLQETARLTIPVSGRLARMAPNPIGSSRIGS